MVVYGVSTYQNQLNSYDIFFEYSMKIDVSGSKINTMWSKTICGTNLLSYKINFFFFFLSWGSLGYPGLGISSWKLVQLVIHGNSSAQVHEIKFKIVLLSPYDAKKTQVGVFVFIFLSLKMEFNCFDVTFAR